MRDAVSNSKKKENPSISRVGNGSPLVILLAIGAIIGIGLLLFKDKIFTKKKSKNLSELAEEKKNETPEPEPEESKQETVTPEQAEKLNGKFADLN